MKSFSVILRTWTPIFLVAVLISVLWSILGINGKQVSAADCTFSINGQRTQITKRCGSGESVQLNQQGRGTTYSRQYLGTGTTCTEKVVITSGASARHSVEGGDLPCNAVTQGSITLTSSGGSGNASIRSALNRIINENCGSGPLVSECIASWEFVISECAAADRNSIESAAYKRSMADCIANRKNVSQERVRNALNNIDKEIAKQEKIAACREDGDKEYSEELDKCVERCEDGQNLDDDGKCVDTTSCAIDGIGWIICPATAFVSQLNDALWGIVEGFLRVNASIFRSGGDTFRAWEAVRNLANIVFVIAFLIIIYSQITGAGITNYGIKKLLPRIVVTAVLVNISFWICAIAVDASNIIGSGLYSLLQSVVGGTSTNTGLGAPIGSWSDVTAWILTGGAGAITVAGAALAIGTYGPLGALALLLPGALIALLAFITVVVLLIAREAFIVILVVIAPLAFVAYLLPNTNQWFDRWRKFFTTLLIMYPSIALLFGGAELAAAVIRAANPNDGLTVIASLVITAVPLFALPALMKAAGGIMSRIGGVVNNPARGPIDRLKKQGERYRQQQKGFRMGDNLKRTKGIREGSGKGLGAAGSRRRRTAAWISGIGNANSADMAEKDKYAEASMSAAKRDYVAERALDDSSYASKLAGGNEKMVTLVQSYAKQAVKEESLKDVKAEEVLLSSTGMGKLFQVLSDGSQSKERRAAALNQIYARGGDQHVQEAVDYVGKNGTSEGMSDIQKFTAGEYVKRKPAADGGTDAAAYAAGEYQKGYEEKLLKRIQDGKFGEKEWAGMASDELIRSAKVVHEAAAGGKLSQQEYDSIRNAIDDASTNENIQLTPEKKELFDNIRKAEMPSKSLQNMNFADPTTIPR